MPRLRSKACRLAAAPPARPQGHEEHFQVPKIRNDPASYVACAFRRGGREKGSQTGKNQIACGRLIPTPVLDRKGGRRFRRKANANAGPYGLLRSACDRDLLS